MLAERPKLDSDTSIRLGVAGDQKQRRRMVLAIVLLVLAVAVVLVRDRHFWFGQDTAGADIDLGDTPPLATDQGAAATQPPTATGQSKSKKHIAPREAAHTPQPAPETPAVTTNRTVLPALEVEVVAGDNHRKLKPGSNTLKVEMEPGSVVEAPESPVVAPAPPTNAAERVRMSVDTTQALAKPVDPSYPMLAKQMKVQGAVVLQALIGTDGLIQDLRILSGPSILASAAREAVRQWRFKPYLQNGQPVETEAKITVNFTISTF